MLALLNRSQHLLRTSAGRYVVIGGSVYVFEIAVIIAMQALGANAILAVGLSFWLGLVVSFIAQKVLTFGDKQADHKILIPQVTAFSALVLFNFGFTLLITMLLAPPLPAVITRTLAVSACTIWNFYLYKTRIFNTNASPVE